MLLHQRNMFVGGGVEHNLGLELVEKGAQPFPVSDVCNHRFNLRRGVREGQFLLEFVNRVFILIQQGYSFGVKGKKLADKLAPDRSAGSGNQDSLTRINMPYLFVKV